jgi:hypothetical protein
MVTEPAISERTIVPYNSMRYHFKLTSAFKMVTNRSTMSTNTWLLLECSVIGLLEAELDT